MTCSCENKPRTFISGLGTILGDHTVAETRDLLGVVDYRFDAVERSYKEIAHPDPDLAADWDALKRLWISERDAVATRLTFLNTSLWSLPASAIVSEPEYQRIIAFTEQPSSASGAPLHVARKGDLHDCQARIQAAVGHPANTGGSPSQDATDWDFSTLKKLDASINQIEKAKEGAASGAASFFSSPLGIFLLVGGAVVGGFYLKQLFRL